MARELCGHFAPHSLGPTGDSQEDESKLRIFAKCDVEHAAVQSHNALTSDTKHRRRSSSFAVSSRKPVAGYVLMAASLKHRQDMPA